MIPAISALLPEPPVNWKAISDCLTLQHADTDWPGNPPVLPAPNGSWFADYLACETSSTLAYEAGRTMQPVAARFLLDAGYSVCDLAAGIGHRLAVSAMGNNLATQPDRLRAMLAVHPDLRALRRLSVTALEAPGEFLAEIEKDPAGEQAVLRHGLAGMLFQHSQSKISAGILSEAVLAGMPTWVKPGHSFLDALPDMMGSSADFSVPDFIPAFDQAVADLKARFALPVVVRCYSRAMAAAITEKRYSKPGKVLAQCLRRHPDLRDAALAGSQEEGLAKQANLTFSYFYQLCIDRAAFNHSKGGALCAAMVLSQNPSELFEPVPDTRVVSLFRDMVEAKGLTGPFTAPLPVLDKIFSLNHKAVHQLTAFGLDLISMGAVPMAAEDVPEFLSRQNGRRTVPIGEVLSFLLAEPAVVAAACTTPARLREAMSMRADWEAIVPHLSARMARHALDTAILTEP